MYLNIILLLNMGLAGGEMEPFIVGGDYMDIRQFPHSIFLYVECKATFVCGGSVLTRTIVLTAGHCLSDCHHPKKNTVMMNYGHSAIRKMKSILASQFLVHHSYNDHNLEYDIGMLYLSHSIPFGDTVKRVAIVKRFPTQAIGGYVTGWGVINEKMETASSMKYVYQELQSHEICLDSITIPPGTFCAQSNKKEGYPEQGDSGGAFVVYNFLQIGIVSFRHIDYDLTAYTNVTYYYDWIKKNARILSCA